MERMPFDHAALDERIERNYSRLLNDPYYQIPDVFSPAAYEWYGDKEGRALLAFVSHYKISGRKIPCMDQMMKEMHAHVNEDSFFGPLAGEIIHEQQLSGHSWLLRGLCEYREQFGDTRSLQMIKSICEHLYYPTKGKYKTYPINRPQPNEGGVSGKSVRILNGWKLSSDVGCAFMSIDGLSHAYLHVRSSYLKELIDEMIEVYLSIDKAALKAQTHCTLTAARGMMRMYHLTNNSTYLDGARSIFDLYVEQGGMTATYQNVNWWRRNDTWTEPCAIVDSLMLALDLYLTVGDNAYQTLATRIYHNGLATAQRENGGAGTDTVVTNTAGGASALRSKKYEAYFCCTMRLSEGLWFISKHTDLLRAQTTGKVERQANGSYMDGDILYAEIRGGDRYLTQAPTVVDGYSLHPLLPYFRIPKDDMEQIEQRILFPLK